MISKDTKNNYFPCQKKSRQLIYKRFSKGILMRFTRTPAGISAELWERILVDIDPASSTVNDYRKVLNLMHSAGNGKYRILTMTTEEAVEYFGDIDQRVENGVLSANTAHRYKATLRSLAKRIEQSGAVEGYINPFNGLLKNEKRPRTEYTEDMFAQAESVRKITRILPNIGTRNRGIIEMILYIGLTPVQIQNIRVCDFHRLDDGSLALDIDAGTFLEHGIKKPEESPLYLSGEPIEFVRSSTRGITWRYNGTFVFVDSVSRILAAHMPDIGFNNDTRKFFLTSRHHEYTYRALHHLIREVCKEAGVEENITPNQLALTGLVNGWYLDHSPDNLYSCWLRYPIPLQQTMDHIREQLPEEFLKSLEFIPQEKR